MSARTSFFLVALLAFAAGGGLWWHQHETRSKTRTPVEAGDIGPGALYATRFFAPDGSPQGLGQFQGQLLVLNFWATWCAPCRDEMPAFDRVARRWKDRGVQVLGITAEEPARVRDFATSLRVSYPLWTGGAEVGELSRRLGNRLGVLPFTALVGRDGRLLETRVGPYTEDELETRLTRFSAN
ncbi:MAG TPA: TlpA disulfide reductase family protein [Usitatibacter sp.]|nr:TlpA disulfide reductase family protein [Usitatibacter sp.]